MPNGIVRTPRFSSYAAYTQTIYGASDKVTDIKAWTGTGDSSNTQVFDAYYCYIAGTTAPTLGATPATSCAANAVQDRDQLQWSYDVLAHQSGLRQV